MYLAEWCITPAINLFINRYSQATSLHSALIYLSLKHLVKLHIETGWPGANFWLHFLPSCVSPRCECIDGYQYIFSLSVALPCWLNHSLNTSPGSHILLLWAFLILHSIVEQYIGFIVCRAIILADIWIIQVTMPVSPTVFIQNHCGWTIVGTFDWMRMFSLIGGN